MLSTQGQGRMGDNVANVFGAKFLAELIPLAVAVDAADGTVDGTADVTADGTDGSAEDADGTGADGNDGAIARGADSEGAMGSTERAGGAGRASAVSGSAAGAVGASSAGSSGGARPGARRIEGLVSKCGAGVGRSDNDRQFFFINGRPVDHPAVRPIGAKGLASILINCC